MDENENIVRNTDVGPKLNPALFKTDIGPKLNFNLPVNLSSKNDIGPNAGKYNSSIYKTV